MDLPINMFTTIYELVSAGSSSTTTTSRLGYQEALRCAGDLGPVSRPVTCRSADEEVAWGVVGSEEDRTAG
eukprot:577510-Hanusia_phi.AAC.1